MDASDPRLPAPRGAGCFLLALVPVSVVLVFLAWGVFALFVYRGRAADGPTVDIAIRACEEAAPVISARLEAMGLTDAAVAHTDDGLRITATLPSDEAVAASIPATLAQPGRLEVRADDGAVVLDSDHVASAGVRMNVMLSPSTFVVLTDQGRAALEAHVEADPDGRVAVLLDGEQVWDQSNRVEVGGELELPPSAENDEARMRLAARRGVVLGSGPLPCEAELVSVTSTAPR